MGDWYANPLWWVLIVTLGTTVLGFAYWFGRWKSQVDSDRELFRKFMEDIVEKIDEIQKDIQQIFNRLPPASTTTGEDLLRLTELDKAISTQLGADVIADDLVPDLRERVAGLTPYKIQKECLAYVEDKYKPPRDIEVRIQQCAFDNDIDRARVLRIVAIELRDRLLPGEAAAEAA